jgi:small subunit ribosomal protein S1
MNQDNSFTDEANANPAAAGDGGEEMDQFDNFMLNYLEAMPGLEVGQLTRATVVEVTRENVMLDVGDKAEGICSRKEFEDFQGNVQVAPGDEVEVVVERRDMETGQVNVSFRKARHRTEWVRVVQAFEKGEPVQGRVTRALKNGVLVDVGVPCFLPASQIDLGRVDKLDALVGQTLDCYIIDLDRQRHRGVLSRRRLLAEQKTKLREEQLATLEEGATVEGRVKSVVEFGVFVELGAIDGLVPRDEVSWEKRVNVAETLKVGTRYKFKILNIDKERGRVTLSRRQMKADPWLSVREEYPQELKVSGKVTNLTNNCAYLVLEDGTEGRIQREHLSWLPTVKKPSDLLKKNQEVEALVLGFDDDKRLLELGLKQMAEDPWADIESRFPVKSRHTVTISDVVSFGAFAKIDDFTKGLIHLTDMTWDRSIKDPHKIVKPGDEVEVVVLKIDKANRRLNFGMRQLGEDPFTAFTRSNPVGSVVTGTVKSVSDFGAFVELAPLVEALLHVSQWGREKVETMASVVKPGDEVTAKIIKLEKKDRKISLSRRALLQDEERKVVDQYKKQATGTNTSTNLGSLLKGLDIKINQ